MRLNKFIADAGIASRRKADELTRNGNVKVNGAVMFELGYDVKTDDLVEVNGRSVVGANKPVYLALNKPTGVITSVTDEKGRPTVMDLVRDIPERVFPVGRLDFNTSGLIIMTNDGNLFQKLAHPSHKVIKTYRAKVSGVLSPERISRLIAGVDIGGYTAVPVSARLIRQAEHYAIAEIQILEGKNRQVRKMFAAVGNKVLELERIAIGEVYLGRLKEGHYRKLTKQEIDSLKDRPSE